MADAVRVPRLPLVAVCEQTPGESAKYNTIGKAYPVKAINVVLEEFESVNDRGKAAWFKMRRFRMYRRETWERLMATAT